IKTQELAATRSGQGGYNQLVFDDTANESRIELSTTAHDTRLQLGHLKQQTGNAREASRGHGAELATRAAIATRAGRGLLVSADARPQASGHHLDSREAIERSEEAHDLVRSLATIAHKHHAAVGADDTPDKLPAGTALDRALDVLRSTANRQDADRHATNPGGFLAAGGGTGTVTAWSEPRVQYSAPAGIAQLTPQDLILAAGHHVVIASRDTQLAIQGNHSMAIARGLALFTAGKSDKGQQPITETGIHLHAANGQVSVQSQSGKLNAAADKRVTVASTTAALSASARKHILATAQGAYLRIEGGNIQLHAPGKVAFKANLKNWTGPASTVPQTVNFPRSDLVINTKNVAKYPFSI
ncbi:type VI secretion system secreted protein VgrG, partial [Aromatoleum tolulyticum]